MILGPCVALALIFILLTKIPNILSIRKVPITYTPPPAAPTFLSPRLLALHLIRSPKIAFCIPCFGFFFGCFYHIHMYT